MSGLKEMWAAVDALSRKEADETAAARSDIETLGWRFLGFSDGFWRAKSEFFAEEFTAHTPAALLAKVRRIYERNH